MPPTRREFINTSLLATGSLLLTAPISSLQLNGKADDKWYLRIRRAAQHNLNEYDPKNLDINAWVDFWTSLKIEVVILTAGGFMAMYPTKLPNHYKSQFLGDRDLFGDYLKALKKKGIRVVARIETNFLHKSIFTERPIWFERNTDGSPREHSETPWVYRTCLFSNYRNEQVPKIINEIASLYDVDGFFTNSWPQVELTPHLCYCENCKRLGDLSTKQISEKSMERTLETINLLNATLKKKNAKLVYNVNIAGGIGAIQDLQKVGNISEWITTDHQGRGGNTPVWDCAQQGKVAYAVMKGRPVTNVVGTKTGPWRHSSNTDAETTLWLAQTTSSGMIPWLVWLGSDLPDKRWQETGRKYFQWLAKNEAHFFNKRPLARLGVVFSNKINELYKAPGSVAGGYWGDPVNRNDRGNPTDYLQGIYYALLEGRFAFDFIHENDIIPEALKNYSAIILPNIALLSDVQANSLRSFVRSGGSILATFETGLYDEWGTPRKEFALSDIFDIHLKPGYKGPVGQIFYASVESEHEIIKEFKDIERLPGGEFYIPVQAPGKHVLNIVPPFPNGIPEMVYPYPRAELNNSVADKDNPALIVREKGNSRLIYFPTDIDKNAWTRGSVDLSRLLQQSVRWMMNGKENVTVEGDGYIEIFAWETEPGFALHILNYNNPNMTRASIRKFYPVGEQRVRMILPEGAKISKATLLRAGTSLAIKQTGKVVEFVIPSITDFEIAALYKG